MGIIATGAHRDLINATKELAAYLGEDEIATAINVGNSFYLSAEEWEHKHPETEGDVMDYYRGSNAYLWQHVFANFGIPHQADLRRLAASLAPDGESVLDVGAGIGSTLIEMPQPKKTHADVGGVALDYAKWRYQQRGMDVRMVSLANDYVTGADPLGDEQFDLIICTEVIEHVQDPVALVSYLARHLKKGGKLVATISFDNDHGLFPMHLHVGEYTNDQFIAEVFPRFGLAQDAEHEEVFHKV